MTDREIYMKQLRDLQAEKYTDKDQPNGTQARKDYEALTWAINQMERRPEPPPMESEIKCHYYQRPATTKKTAKILCGGQDQVTFGDPHGPLPGKRHDHIKDYCCGEFEKCQVYKKKVNRGPRP